jgi:hypothetical protein
MEWRPWRMLIMLGWVWRLYIVTIPIL